MSKAIITIELDLDKESIISGRITKESRKWLEKDMLRIGKRFCPTDGILLHSNMIGDAFPVKVLKCVIAKEGKKP